jgi:hypothetical protein
MAALVPPLCRQPDKCMSGVQQKMRYDSVTAGMTKLLVPDNLIFLAEIANGHASICGPYRSTELDRFERPAPDSDGEKNNDELHVLSWNSC